MFGFLLIPKGYRPSLSFSARLQSVIKLFSCRFQYVVLYNLPRQVFDCACFGLGRCGREDDYQLYSWSLHR